MNGLERLSEYLSTNGASAAGLPQLSKVYASPYLRSPQPTQIAFCDELMHVSITVQTKAIGIHPFIGAGGITCNVEPAIGRYRLKYNISKTKSKYSEKS